MRRLLPLGLALASGCLSWDKLPHGASHYLDTPLWDPVSVTALDDDLFVQQPYTGGLLRVNASGATAIDMASGRVDRVVPTPDGTLLTFVTRWGCEEDRESLDASGDCDEPELLTDLVPVANDTAQAPIPLQQPVTELALSEDGRWAIGYLDIDDLGAVSGFVNLDAVLTLDLVSGDALPVQVGFAADRVLFVEEDGVATRAVVLSRSQVAVLDLTGPQPQRQVVFPLTLDPDQEVTPVDVALTPDGRYALITVVGSDALYTLDLENPSVNIVTLAAQPSAMAVDADQDRTVIVSNGAARVEILDHHLFSLRTLQLDEGMNAIYQGESFMLLYDVGGGRDAYRLDDDDTLTEYRLQGRASRVEVAPDETWAVALTAASVGTGAGLEIIDLTDDDTIPFLLGANGLDVAFTPDSETALVLQQDEPTLYRLGRDGRVAEVDLNAPGRALRALADGTFAVTHDAPLGLISFYDPSDDSITEVGGFASFDLLEPVGVQHWEVE